MIQNTDPDLVGFEFDVGWGQMAGIDCAAYVRKYPGRFPIIHVKECDKIAQTEAEYEHFPQQYMALAKMLADDVLKAGGPPKFPAQAAALMYNSRNWNVELGTGLIDWEDLRDAAVETQDNAAFVNEREYYHIGKNLAGEAIVAAEMDYKFLKNLLS